MPSVVPAVSENKHVTTSRKKFRTVLGLDFIIKDTDIPASAPLTVGHNTLTRSSIDIARSYKQRRKQRSGRSSVADISFFRPNTTPSNKLESVVVDNMKDPVNSRPPRRPPVRMDEDGPWSVSVAETPHDARSYSLYIKTPTHNLTLTRTAMEIVELHHKLAENQAGAKVPQLPIDPTSLPSPPPKRKSTFLNTLSRLASPTHVKSGRHQYQRSNVLGVMQSNLPTPLSSPSNESVDPFIAESVRNGLSGSLSNGTTANSTITGLAAYLTTISNTPGLRQAHVWKRFVRVRTDDLESVRVERAIKRTRSDLASHVSSKVTVEPYTSSSKSSATASIDEQANGLDTDGDIDPTVAEPEEVKVTEEEIDAAHVAEMQKYADLITADGGEENKVLSPLPTVAQTSPTEESSKTVGPDPVDTTAANVTSAVEEDIPPSTPLAPEPPARIHRSQSADPDKSSRLSRVYTSSVSNLDGASSQTGDDSSASTTPEGRRSRKKRSVSVNPNRELKKSQRKVVIDDFEMMRVLGKGCAGKVLLVRHKSTADLYALKAITKRHVLAHQELQHTLTEQAVLKRMAAESKDPFVVKLWWSFHDKENLFLVMDFHPGGDLATQLARWGRLGRDRARFYAAEIVEGVEGLHAAGVIYRDLKPENILIGADGHIVLTDFGLSKEFPRRTAATTAMSPLGGRGSDFYTSVQGSSQPATPPWMKIEKGGELASGWPGQLPGQGDSTSTFCGTAEYLAPEVIQGLSYSYEVDWWSFGTMLYEMLTGITPFWANNHSDMYVKVLQDDLQFPDDRGIDQDTKSLIRGLLQRNPALRMCEPRIKRHPYFSMIDWSHVYYKRYIPPYIPPIDPSNASDTQNFDETFLDMEPVLDDVNDNEQTDTDQEREQTDTDRTDGEESNTTPSQSRSSSIRPQQTQQQQDDSVDVFDGYSFKGRHSVLIDDEEEEEGEESGEESEGDEASVIDEAVDHDVEAQTRGVEVAEPKTPEARPSSLPEPVEPSPEVTSQTTEEQPVEPTAELTTDKVEASAPIEGAATPDIPTPVAEEASQPRPEKEPKPRVAIKTPVPRTTTKGSRGRREKSGVPALDRYLSSDAIDEDEEATEKEDEDDDWDFVEAADGEDRNGSKGTLFARGVVDRYRLAVFRKASTPQRSFSGLSKDSEMTVSEITDSPSPSDKQRRGRTGPGLNFRKHPRQFLQPKSPPSSFSSKNSGTTKTINHSNSATSTSSSAGLLTPSPSTGGSLLVSPSLKSKESAVSVGTRSVSSDQSGKGDVGVEQTTPGPTETGKTLSPEEPEKTKNKKLKKYKENAEKVFSIFASSPRQP